MFKSSYRGFFVSMLFGGALLACCEFVVAAEMTAPLKIIARKPLEGPSRWGVPPEFRLIRNFTELVRAVGLDEANAAHQAYGKPKLDFDRYMFVYVSAGSRRSSGYAVHIVDVAQRNEQGRPRVVVRWSLYEPKGFVLWVITTPAELVMVERAEGEPTFEQAPFVDPPTEGDGKDSPPRNDEPDGARGNPRAAVEWDALVREYDALGLPRPPADARLVAKFHGMELVDVRDVAVPLHAPRYLPGFAWTDAAGKRRLLVGTETLDLSAGDAGLIDVGADGRVPGAFVAAYDGGAFEIDAALPAALECRRRGLQDLADQLLRIRSNYSFEHPDSSFRQPLGLPLDVALRHVAWTHWGNRLTVKGTDRAEIHGRMAELLLREPALQTPSRRTLVRSLEAALRPSAAPPGTPRRLIDDLVELDALYFDRRGAVGTPAPVAELAKRGWEALPTLVEHLDDRRLTRSVVRPWDGSPAYVPQVGELISNLVQELAGDEGLDWKRTPADRFLLSDSVRDWRQKAEAQGEEAYLVRHVVPRLTRATMLYEPMLSRLAIKYPGRLPEVYRRLLADRPDVNAWSLVSAIAATAAPDVAADVLAEGASHAAVARRAEALEALARIDRTRFENALIAALAEMPPKPTGRYAYSDQVLLVRLCRESDRPEVWEALRTAAVAADVGLRLEMIDELGKTPKAPYEVWKRSIDVLARFLDDASIRDTTADPEKYEGCAGAWLPKLEVRNWAAFQLATILGLDMSTFRAGKPIGDDQWTKLRDVVKAELPRL